MVLIPPMMKNLLYILIFVPLALFGQENYSLSFDGIDDYVEIDSSESLRILNDLSISLNLSFKEQVSSSNWFGLLAYMGFEVAGQESEEKNILYGIMITPSDKIDIYHEYDDGINTIDYNSSIQINYDSYVDITVTRNIELQQYLYYENGHLVDSMNFDFNPSGGISSNLYIGSRANGENACKVDINSLQIWDDVLDEQEIMSYINCPPDGNEDDIVGYWNFNEGSGDTVYDLSGNGNHGIINGATYSEGVPETTCSILDQLYASFDAWNVTIDLSAGWNMFGYGCPSPIDVSEGLSIHTESIAIVKDNNGAAYMTEWNFNGIGDFTPGFGYQIKVTEAIEGFSLCDWYVNDIPEDNIVSLQDYIVQLEDSIELLNTIPTYEVGDFAEGGIVFYIDETGEQGLVAALEDLGAMDWYDASSSAGAATYQGFSDWFSPSVEQLELMYNNIGNGGLEGNIGSFVNDIYWSSTEQMQFSTQYPDGAPYESPAYNFVDFENGSISFHNNEEINYVRPIRSF